MPPRAGAAHPGASAWPFVGRDDELSELVGLITTGEQRGAVVVGPPGMGKTALVARAAEAARAAGMAVVGVRATTALRQLRFGALASILPADVEMSTQDLFALLRQYASRLAGIAGGRRLLLTVDDAHLLDEASTVLLFQLATRGEVTEVVTVRSGEPVPEAITGLWKDRWLDRVELRALDRGAVQRLLEQVLGGAVDPIAADGIAQRCRGNPMFVRELVAAASAEGRFRDDPGGWWLDGWPAASGRLVDLVGATVAKLTDDEERLVEAILFAEPLGPAELDALELRDAAETLERKGIITSSLSGRRLEIRLAHPMVGEVVGRLTPLARRRIAATRADALERTGLHRREDTLLVATWRLHAGGGSAELLVAGATSARRRHDYPLTEQLAIAAVDRGGGFDAHYLAAEAASLLGRPDEADAKLAALAPLASTDAERAQVATARSSAALRTGRAVPELLAEAETTISDPVWRDQLLAARGALVAVTAGFRASLATLAPLVGRAAGPVPDAAYLVAIQDLTQLGRLDDAEALVPRARAALADATTGAWSPELMLRELELLTWSGRLAAAESMALGAQRAAADHDAMLWAYAAMGLATCYLEQGRARLAAATAARAFRLFADSGRPALARPPGWTATMAFALAGDVTAAQRTLAQVESLPGTTVFAGPRRLAVEGWLKAVAGQRAPARRNLIDAAAGMIELGDQQHAAAALHAAARLGDPDGAHDRLQALGATMDRDLVRARVEHVRALRAGDPEALELVARDFAAMGANLYAAEADARAAIEFTDRDRPREATAAARRAAALAARCDAAPTVVATQDSGSMLTPAEIATAELAAAGQSNRAIADALFVSVRTVENRLYRVYAKLGISGRDELARALEQR